MRRTAHFAALILALGLVRPSAAEEPASAGGVYALVNGPQGQVKASLFSDAQASLVIATAGARVVTLGDLATALGATHQAHGATKPGQAGKKDFTPVLDRLIGVRLLVQEAQAMGLDELPEVKTDLGVFKESSLREQLQREVLKDVKPDPAGVERLFKEAVREWQIHALLFAKEEDAKAFAAAAKAGKPFDALAKKAVEEKKATGGGEARWVAAASQLPQVAGALAKLKPEQVTGALKVEQGFTVLRLEGVRYPENAAARAEATNQALALEKKKALKAFYDGLVKKYSKTDEALLKKLDFEAKKPGFKALAKDKRVITTIQGDEPIRVSDLADAITLSFFHGVEEAIKMKKVNRGKYDLVDALLSRKLVKAEVARRKLADTEQHRSALADYRDQALFGTFVEKVIVPEIKPTEGDAKRYYDAHKAEFTYPGFYTVSSLCFESAAAAKAAFDKLKVGTDLKWLKTNAEGQVLAEKRRFEIDGTLAVSGLTPEVAKALAGAKTGDVRMMEQSGQHFVLLVKQATPPAAQPYEEVKETIRPKLTTEMVSKSLDAWLAKLRQAHPVKVYITQIVG